MWHDTAMNSDWNTQNDFKKTYAKSTLTDYNLQRFFSLFAPTLKGAN